MFSPILLSIFVFKFFSLHMFTRGVIFLLKTLNIKISHACHIIHCLQDGEFAWDKETQGIILGAFFWGYLITQIPGGWLSERFGGKRVFGWFMFLTAVATLLTPVGARVSPYFLIVLRAVKGIGEASILIMLHIYLCV